MLNIEVGGVSVFGGGCRLVSDLNIGICLELVICDFAFGCGITALGWALENRVFPRDSRIDWIAAFCSIPESVSEA